MREGAVTNQELLTFAYCFEENILIMKKIILSIILIIYTLPLLAKVSAPSLTGCQEDKTECSGWTGSGGESWQAKVDTIWPARHYRELNGKATGDQNGTTMTFEYDCRLPRVMFEEWYPENETYGVEMYRMAYLLADENYYVLTDENDVPLEIPVL